MLKKKGCYKQYIVQKLVKARSLTEALRVAKKAPVDSCWIDKDQPEEKDGNLGFTDQGNKKT